MSQHTGSVPDTPRATDWRDKSACRDEDPELFFPVGSSPAARDQTRHAKVICWSCPSLEACGQWALDTRQGFGVWGGMSETERRTILRRRGIRLKEPDPDTRPDQPRGKGRPRAECGTRSAYARHVRNGEPIDDACRAENTAATNRVRATGTTRAFA